MATIDRLLRANRTLMQVPVWEKADGTLVIISPTGTTCPFETPTSAVLDAWRQVVTTSATGARHGGNISCAVVDDLDLGTGDSDTDDELTICSVGNEQTRTFANVEAQIHILRDNDPADTGVFNLATFLNIAVDTRYGWVDRIGYSSQTAFASGQAVSIYEALNDVPLDQKEDRGNLKLEVNPVPTGNFIQNYALAS
jgi:hypothetical protein